MLLHNRIIILKGETFPVHSWRHTRYRRSRVI